jgi:hypothetical protein
MDFFFIIMAKPYYLFLLLLFPLGFITAFYGFPQVIERSAGLNVSITSFEDGAIVHSKVVIDASFDGDVQSIAVKINGKEYANYVPYVWNNILEPAGTYEIEVEATDKLLATAKTSKTVIIPAFEVYTPENFTCTEDIVIHEGQTVIWRDGIFNCSIPFVDNGVNIVYYKPVFLNIYGYLIMFNMTLSVSKDISLEHEGKLKLENSTLSSIGGEYVLYMNGKTEFECINSNFGSLHCFSGSECILNIDENSIGNIV